MRVSVLDMVATRRATGPAVKASSVEDPTTTKSAVLARDANSHEGVPFGTSSDTDADDRSAHQEASFSASAFWCSRISEARPGSIIASDIGSRTCTSVREASRASATRRARSATRRPMAVRSTPATTARNAPVPEARGDSNPADAVSAPGRDWEDRCDLRAAPDSGPGPR